VIWRSICQGADDPPSSDWACCHDLSELALENVVYQDWWSTSASSLSGSDLASCHDLGESSLETVVSQDWSTPASSLSGINSNSHEPDINPHFKASKGLPHLWEKQAVSEQEHEFLLKHDMWSVGSEGHVNGSCKPCNYVHSPKGCKSGLYCKFCHMPHVPCSSHSGNRPSKKKREFCKQLVGSLESLYGNRLDNASNLLKHVASQSVYMQKIVANFDKSKPEQGQRPAAQDAQPVMCQNSARARRVEVAKNLVAELHRIGAAESAATAAGGTQHFLAGPSSQRYLSTLSPTEAAVTMVLTRRSGGASPNSASSADQSDPL